MKTREKLWLILVCVLLSALAGFAVAWLLAQDQEIAQGSNYFGDIVTEDIDMYGDGVVRDSLNDTVAIQVTSGGLRVTGATTSPNIIAGYSGNAASGQGSVVGGGGANSYGASTSAFNLCTGDYCGVLSGLRNYNYGTFSTIGGGNGNRIDSWYAFLGGGVSNRIYLGYGFIGAGQGNISNNGGAVMGGTNNRAQGQYSALSSGHLNEISTLSSYGLIGNGAWNVLGTGNVRDGSTREFSRNIVSGGPGTYGTIINGESNAVGGYMSLIGNGFYNTIADTMTATVTGVYTNYSDYAEWSGTKNNSHYCEWDDETNEATCHTSYNSILGGFGNLIANAAVVTYTEMITSYSPITPAVVVACQAGYGFVGNGVSNTISGPTAQYSSILNGYNGMVTSTYASLLGGYEGQVTGDYATALGGYRPDASGNYAVNLGGYLSTAAGDYSVAGGRSTTAAGDYSIALGRQARALYNGSFVWADDLAENYDSPGENTFSVRARGGITLTTHGAGVSLDGPIIMDGMQFTYTVPITISGIYTNVRFLFYQVP